MATPRTIRIGVLGPQESGKTIFLACLFDWLKRQDTLGDFEINDKHTASYVHEVTEALEQGKRPRGTLGKHDLSIECYPQEDSSGLRATFVFTDYRGGWLQNKFDDNYSTILEILEKSDALLFLIDTDAVVQRHTTHDEGHYLSALITMREKRRKHIPLHVLFTKTDLYPDLSDENLQAEVQKLVRRTLSSKALELPESVYTQWKRRESLTRFFRVSCVPMRPIDFEHFRTERGDKSNGSVFRPKGLQESFPLLVSQIQSVTRRRAAARVTNVVMTGTLVFGGTSAGAILFEQADHARTLTEIENTRAYLQGKIVAEAYVARWEAWRYWPLLGFADERLGGVARKARELGDLARDFVLTQAQQAAAADPGHEDPPRNDKALYTQLIGDLRAYVDNFDPDPPELLRAIDLYDEKVRYLAVLESLRGMADRERVAAVDTQLKTQSFPIYGEGMRQYRDSQARELAWRDSYESLSSSLPGEGAPRSDLEQAIERIDQWLVANRPSHPGDELIARTEATLRRLQASRVEQAFQAVSTENANNPGLTAEAQRANWVQFLGAFQANPVRPGGSAEATRWASLVAEARRLVAGLDQRIAREAEEAKDQARRTRIAEMEGALSAVKARNPSLTENSVADFRAFMRQYESGPDSASLTADLRRFWKELAIEAVREPFRRFRRDRDRTLLPRILASQRAYRDQSREFGSDPDSDSLVNGAAEYATWAGSRSTLTVAVEQEGSLYAEVWLNDQRVHSTVRQASANRVDLRDVSAFDKLLVRFRSSDAGSDTTVDSRAVDLLRESLFTDAVAHRGRVIRVTIEFRRPSIPAGL